MRKKVTGLILAAALALAGCEDMTEQQQDDLTAGLIGAGVLGGGAALLGAEAGWVVVAAAAGAAAGVLIARNSRTNQCAYADGKGGYVTRRC